MRSLATAAGTLLFSLGLAGLVTVGTGSAHGLQLELSRAAARLGLVPAHAEPARTPLSPEEAAHVAPLIAERAQGAVAAAGPSIAAAPSVDPVHLTAPRIRLDVDVVSAQLVRVAGGVTWEVPAFRAGHAQGTPGVGATGNMVLLGHVSSLNAGNVFQDLDRVVPGDEIVIVGATGETFTYRVDESLRVERTDTSIMSGDSRPRVTLLTCTGTWLPSLADFSHRLAVQATLAMPAEVSR